ncbi:GxxExxY protein [Sphingorhabdus arenilitoris]|uniref:GxxExxY protein n=1 Tax=Sphingorhabdus arenilitoris TaxID=1490041 RepID=A0ABV8RLH0_9SPHN
MLERAEKLASIAIDCGFKIHTEIGPGLLESVYEHVLARRLEQRGLRVDRQKPVGINIDGISYPDAFRYDLLIEDTLLIEVKSIEKLGPIPVKQTLTYIRLMQLPLGLVFNFGSETFRQGIRRIMNNIA